MNFELRSGDPPLRRLLRIREKMELYLFLKTWDMAHYLVGKKKTMPNFSYQNITSDDRTQKRCAGRS
jgi:hypothetical protein